MKPRYVWVPVFLFAVIVAVANADNPKPPHISKQTRMDLVRAFNAELVYIRSPFPMGKKGLAVKNGVVSPGPQELQQLIAMWGPAVKPGDQAQITNIVIKDDRIHFEINGGPVKKPKWYQRIQISGNGGSTPVVPSDAEANPRGSFVDLLFDHYVPELSPQELKDHLRPVFDFNSKSAVEAYLDTVPPKVKDAIKNHQVLVGMNREMVIYSKGRAPKKIREKDGEVEYEDWIYGDPPANVDFVRLVGDEVVRVETMKVNGEKQIRTEKEVTLETTATAAKEQPQERPPNAPSLRRPGEDVPTAEPGTTIQSNKPLPPAPPPQPPSGGSPPSPPNWYAALRHL